MRAEAPMVLWVACVAGGTVLGLHACEHPRPRKPPTDHVCQCECPEPPESPQLIEATVLLERCETELRTVTETITKTKTRTKTVQVEREGAPKKCAGEPPKLQPVKTIECQPGLVCLDEANQARLAANILATSSWMERVRRCEEGEP